MLELLIHLLDLLFTRDDIGRGEDGSPYLTRWILFGRRRGRGRLRVYLHWFRRSDLDVLHDHPWRFASIILAGGYWEQTPAGRRWYGPGRILVRPAEWTHRIEVPAADATWTIVLAGAKTRDWGFHCPAGWRHWELAERGLREAGNVCS